MVLIWNDNTWRVYLVWELFANRSSFSLEEIINASQQYIAELSEYLKNNFEFDFLIFLQSEEFKQLNTASLLKSCTYY